MYILRQRLPSHLWWQRSSVVLSVLCLLQLSALCSVLSVENSHLSISDYCHQPHAVNNKKNQGLFSAHPLSYVIIIKFFELYWLDSQKNVVRNNLGKNTPVTLFGDIVIVFLEWWHRCHDESLFSFSISGISLHFRKTSSDFNLLSATKTCILSS